MALLRGYDLFYKRMRRHYEGPQLLEIYMLQMVNG
jgi:hypothetical protein